MAESDAEAVRVDDAVPPEAGRQRSDLLGWLAEHLTGMVGALTDEAHLVPVPEEIPLGPGHGIEQRPLLELVLDEDRVPVAHAFLAALDQGTSSVRAHLADRPDELVMVRYFDLRPELGVCIRTIAPDDDEEPTAPESELSDNVTGPRLGLITKASTGTILAVDRNIELMLGWSAEEMVGRSPLDFIHVEDQARAVDNWIRMLVNGGTQAVRLRYRTQEGGWLWLETSNDPGEDEAPVICQVIDISEEMAATEALRHHEQLLRRLTETVPVGLLHVAPDCRVTYANSYLSRLLGAQKLEDLDDVCALLDEADAGSVRKPVVDVLAGGDEAYVELTARGRDSDRSLRCRVHLAPVNDGDVVLGVIACVVDVTELKVLATRDSLTGLHNRGSIFDVLQRALDRPDGRVGVIFADLDSFKSVNDLYGHGVGDEVLVTVADVLRRAVRRCDDVGRLGGDEFLVVCPEVGRRTELEMVARRIRRALSDVFSGCSHGVTASLGIALSSSSTQTAADLVAVADREMHAVKATRR